MPELVRERGDDGQTAPVLVVVGGVARAAPLAGPGVGDLNRARPGPVRTVNVNSPPSWPDGDA